MQTLQEICMYCLQPWWIVHVFCHTNIIANGHPIDSTECSITPKWRSVIAKSAEMHVSASYASSLQLGTTRAMQTCRVTCGQSAQTTTREAIFALLLMDTQLTPQSAQQHRSERNSTICRHACFSVLRLVSAAWYTSGNVIHL
jgi:hypothetical protein